MHPTKRKIWRCGPLQLWERHFEDHRIGAPPHTVQWSLVLEGSLVVIAEEDG